MCIGARSTGSMNNHLHPSPTFLSTVNCGLVFHIKYWHVTFEVGQLENVAFYFQEFEIYYRFEFFGHNLPCVCAWKFFDRPTRWNTQKGQFDWAETKYKADNRKRKKMCLFHIIVIDWMMQSSGKDVAALSSPPTQVSFHERIKDNTISYRHVLGHLLRLSLSYISTSFQQARQFVQ